MMEFVTSLFVMLNMDKDRKKCHTNGEILTSQPWGLDLRGNVLSFTRNMASPISPNEILNLSSM